MQRLFPNFCYTFCVERKRFFEIDFLRAIGIVGVIATHVFSYNLVTPLNTFIWNYLHFVITSFIFCSGYVMYVLYKDKVSSWSSLSLWYKNRLSRLLVPFYIYFLVYLCLSLLFPQFFSGLGLQNSAHYIWQSLALLGGINENWLPLLFVELTFLFPFLIVLLKKVKIVLWLYIVLGILFTVWITISPFPYAYYRWVMWIPWSLVFILSWYFAQKEDKKARVIMYTLISIVSSIFFAELYILLSHFHRSVVLIDNKYPPNFFYIFYEFAISFLLLVIASWKKLQSKWLTMGVTYLSSRSYALFFVHFPILDFCLQINKQYRLHLSVWIELLLVTIVSILLVSGWELSKRKLHITST